MVGLCGGWKRSAAVVVMLAGVGGLGARPGWAQAPAEEASSGEVLSEEQLEALLDSPVAQPSDALTDVMFGPEQLTPYFAEGTLARARAEYDRGRYRRARKLLDQEEQTLPVRFLKAQIALNLRDFATAADAFGALAEEYTALRDHCLVRAAHASEKLRRWEQAATHYRAVSPASPLYPDARFSLAKVLERRRDIPGALAALNELIESRQAKGPDAIRLKALMATCDLARKQGLYNVEHRALLEVWATSPLSREAQRAQARLKGLPMPLKWRVRRAEAFLDLHHNLTAMDQLEKMLPQLELPDELSCRAHLAYGKALRKERKHRRAIQVLSPVVQQCGSPELRPRALYLLGYSQSVVEPREAITTYATLARDYPEHGLADDALFFEAWQLQRTEQPDAALARYEEVARRYPAGNFSSEALFRAFWFHHRKGDPVAALATLKAVEQLPLAAKTDEALWRSRYWTARVLEARNEPRAAFETYERIANERPAAWYGVLARSRLARLAPEKLVPPVKAAATVETPSEPEEVWPLPLGTLRKDVHFTAGVELMRLGMPGAVQELLAVDHRSLSEDSGRLIYQMLQRSGRERAARHVARVTLKQDVHGPLSPTTRPIWEATWPLAYRPLVERHARSARVDPDLLQGLIREESRFNPRARSPTGALGLTQLMPATAREVAARLKISVNEQVLLQPGDNIRVGAAYLGQLLNHFEGNPAFAVAAYNAGPNAVERWQKALPRAELDEWVEHIAFEETREYVKRVLGSYSAYKLLYTDKSPLLQIAPEPSGETSRLIIRQVAAGASEAVKP
jgi:soluble lytic murein transglycosylase